MRRLAAFVLAGTLAFSSFTYADESANIDLITDESASIDLTANEPLQSAALDDGEVPADSGLESALENIPVENSDPAGALTTDGGAADDLISDGDSAEDGPTADSPAIADGIETAGDETFPDEDISPDTDMIADAGTPEAVTQPGEDDKVAAVGEESTEEDPADAEAESAEEDAEDLAYTGNFDEDEALISYMDSFFPKKTTGGPAHIKRRYKRDLLTANEKVVYDQILAQVQDLLAGRRSSTQFTVDYTQFPGYKAQYTESDLGCVIYNESTGQFNSYQYRQTVRNLLDFSLETVRDALLDDRPEMFFWYGRLNQLQDIEIDGYTTSGGVASLSNTAIIFRWGVSNDYMQNSSDLFTVNTARLGRINTASANAQAIADTAASRYSTDADKMKFYMSAICYLVSYDQDAYSDINTSSESDPWELINVFDNDWNTNVVCEGYSKAFKYLCDKTKFSDPGLDVYIVSGTISSSSQNGGPHMWNIVRMNGTNYLVDVTNSDNGSSSDFDFFLRGMYSGDVYSYKVKAKSGSIFTYKYDSDTLNIYTTAELTLSSSDYYRTTHTHSWDGGTVTEQPTCTKTGVRVYTCSTCGTERAEIVPAYGHAWRNAWVTTSSPTVWAEGTQTDTCARDGAHTRTRSVPKLTPTIQLNAYSVPLKVGQKSKAVCVYTAAGDYIVSVISSKKKIVKAGVAAGNHISLKGKKKGKAKVTVTLASGIRATLTVKVQKKKVTTKKISVASGKTLVIPRGSQVSIGAGRTPITSQDKVKYSSSKKKVASVSKSGVITAKKKGKATIKVKSGKKTVKIKVRVY